MFEINKVISILFTRYITQVNCNKKLPIVFNDCLKSVEVVYNYWCLYRKRM